MGIAVFCGFVIKKSPINAIQMLWINVIMDSFSALALATEPPTEELLDRYPIKKRDPIINRAMWNSICFQALCQFIVLLLVLFLSPSILNIPSTVHMKQFNYEEAVHFTFFFNCFVFMQVFNFVNARVLKKAEINPFQNICSNPIFWFIEGCTVVGQIIFVQFLGQPVKCAPLSLYLHLLSIVIGSSALLFGLIEKMIPDEYLPFPLILKEKEEVDSKSMTKGIMSMTHMGPYKGTRSGIIN